MQRSEQQQFLLDTTVEQLVKDTLREVALVHNLRQKICKLKLEGAELAQYGPAKQLDKQGIDTYAEDSVEQGEFYKMDPTGRRTGNGVIPFCKPLSESSHLCVLCRRPCNAWCTNWKRGKLDTLASLRVPPSGFAHERRGLTCACAECHLRRRHLRNNDVECAACSSQQAQVLLRTLDEAEDLATHVRHRRRLRN